MSNINIIVAEAGKLGINTDIFETNVLNLSVVIGVLIFYGRVALADLINSRKDLILKNLQDADSKFRQAEENLLFAQKNFEIAQLKAKEIRDQSSVVSKQTYKNLLNVVDEDIKRLKISNLSFIKFEEEKSISEVCHKLSLSALSKSIDNLNNRLNSILEKRIISQNIDKLSVKFLTCN